MNHVNHHHVAELQESGYELFEVNINDNAPGSVVVADPVLCMSGNKQWAEVKRVTLRTPKQVAKFLNDRC